MQPNTPHRRGKSWRSHRKFINTVLVIIALFLVSMTALNVLFLINRTQTPKPGGDLAIDIEEGLVVTTTTIVIAADERAAIVVPTTVAEGSPTREGDSGSTSRNSSLELPPPRKNPIVEAKPKSGDNDIDDVEEINANPKDSDSKNKLRLEPSDLTFEAAIDKYYALQHEKLKENENPKQNTKSFVDINEVGNDGVLLPHDASQIPDPKTYEACDNRDADFTGERDKLCQEYLSNVNNMVAIKALGSLLYSGRTIKFKVFYRHNGIQGVVKVSQNKFFFEAASEYLSFSVDRALNLTYVPPTAYVSLPVDYMRAASASVGAFFSQWFELFIPEYKYTQGNLVTCPPDTPYQTFLLSHPPETRNKAEIHSYETKCSQVAIQLWMKDVHSALDSFLAVPHDYSDKFAKKYMRPFRTLNESNTLHSSHKYAWPPTKPYRLQALGDLCDRMIFDFLIGNTDRGMNDHNNFVYGGCDDSTDCKQPPPEGRLKSKPKYAFIDHGSSFYSHKEPEGNPFTGNQTMICRYRKTTYEKLWYFHRDNDEGYIKDFPDDSRPFIHFTRSSLPKGLFNVIHLSVFKMVQDRLQKVVRIVDDCIDLFGEDAVFSL